MLSSIDINNIAMSHDPNGSTQNQCQSRSVPLAQQSVNRTYSSTDLDTPRDNIDDISSTLTHTLEQDITNVDNSSETSESQSIDITSINLNNHVANDSEFSLSIHTSASHSNDGVIQNQGQLFVSNSSDANESQSIDIKVINLNNHVANDCESTSVLSTQQSSKTTQGPEDNSDTDKIATRGRESEREMEGEREQGNDKGGGEKGRKMDSENEKARETEREREQGNGKNGNEKRRKKERKSEKKRERKKRNKRARKSESEKRNDSALTDEEEDSVAPRMKKTRRRNRVITDEEEDSIASRTRNKRSRKHNKTRRRILTDQQQDDEDNENESYEDDNDNNNSYEY